MNKNKSYSDSQHFVKCIILQYCVVVIFTLKFRLDKSGNIQKSLYIGINTGTSQPQDGRSRTIMAVMSLCQHNYTVNVSLRHC